LGEDEQVWNETGPPAPPELAGVWRELQRLARETRAVLDGTADRTTARAMLAGWVEALEAISSCQQCGGTGHLTNGMGCNRCAGKGVKSFWDEQRNRSWDKSHGYVPAN
jgi:hypothetical protein